MKELVASTVGSAEMQQLKQKHELKVVWLAPCPAAAAALAWRRPRSERPRGPASRPPPGCRGASRPRRGPARSEGPFAVALTGERRGFPEGPPCPAPARPRRRPAVSKPDAQSRATCFFVSKPQVFMNVSSKITS